MSENGQTAEVLDQLDALRAAAVRLDAVVTSYMLGELSGADVAHAQQALSAALEDPR